MIELINLSNPILTNPNANDFRDRLTEAFNSTGIIERMAPGRYDITPKLISELNINTNTLRVKKDGTGILITTPREEGVIMQELTTTKQTIPSAQLLFTRKIIRIPEDVPYALISMEFSPQLEIRDYRDQLTRAERRGSQGKLIFSAIIHRT